MRFIFLLITTFTFLIAGCTTTSDVQPKILASFTPENHTTELPVTATATKGMLAESEKQPTLTPEQPILPTPTLFPTETVAPVSEGMIEESVIEEDCAKLIRPLTYSQTASVGELRSLSTNEICLVSLPTNQSFIFGGAMTEVGVYGVNSSADESNLVRINFDGTVTDLNIVVGGFFGGTIIVSADESQIAWSDGDGDPEDANQFIAKLWVANADGSDQRVIYEHSTNLEEALLLEIMMPIGFLPSGNILFSIEPSGRGGGWIYIGEHSNLLQTSIVSAEKTASDLIFSCPDRTPFCVGDFTADFSLFAHVDREQQTLSIVELDSGLEAWSITITDRTFIGRPQFNSEQDLAFVAVDVVDYTNELRPENGYIGLINYPYSGEVVSILAELVSNLNTWVDDDRLMYYEVSSNINPTSEWRYPIINRDGVEIGKWEGRERFPIIIH